MKKKYFIYMFSIIAMALSFAACSDDNEPDTEPVKEPKDYTVVEGAVYDLHYPLKYTFVNIGKVTNSHQLWRAGTMCHDDPLCNLRYSACTWGDQDLVMEIERTDGEELVFTGFLYIDSEQVEPPVHMSDYLDVIINLVYRADVDYHQFQEEDFRDFDGLYTAEGLKIERIDKYKVRFTVGAVNKPDEKLNTRVLHIYTLNNLKPTKITSESGKTEYKLTDEVLGQVPNGFILSLGTFVLPMPSNSPARNVFTEPNTTDPKNVFMDCLK